MTSCQAQVGQTVEPGMRLLSLVTELIWIDTNFKETQVANMHVGDVATIHVDGLDGKKFNRHVDSFFAILASLACSSAWNLDSMIVFRVLQGFTGGALIPMAFTLIVTLLPAEKRPIGMALFGVTATFAPAIGPTLGGWLTEVFSWHYIFYLNVIPGLDFSGVFISFRLQAVGE